MIPFWVYAIQENSKEDQRLASRLLHSQIYILQRKLSTSLYSEHLSQHIRGGFCWHSQVEDFLYVLHLAINIISLFEWDKSQTPFPFPHLTTEQIIKMLTYLWQYRRIENTEHALFCSTQKYLCCAVLSQFSHVQLFVTLWAVACQAPQSMGFSRQEYWSELPCPLPGDLPNPGTEPESLMSYHLLPSGGFFTTSATWEVPKKYLFSTISSLFSALQSTFMIAFVPLGLNPANYIFLTLLSSVLFKFTQWETDRSLEAQKETKKQPVIFCVWQYLYLLVVFPTLFIINSLN